MTSSRLPGKHLLEVNGRPMIGYLIERLQAVSAIDQIVVAMTLRSNDDPLDAYVKSLGVEVFRGDEDDVMGRVLKAAQTNAADIICEVTGDCPIIDPMLIEQAIKTYQVNQVAYVNNGRGLPDGMGCQVFSTQDLALSESMTSAPLDREHVTLHIRNHPEIFPAIYLPPLAQYYWPELRVTLDENADYLLIRKIIENVKPEKLIFNCLDVFELLRLNPEWLKINKHVIPKGETLEADRSWLL